MAYCCVLSFAFCFFGSGFQCGILCLFNNLEKTDPSEIERTYNIRKQQTRFYRVFGKGNNSYAP